MTTLKFFLFGLIGLYILLGISAYLLQEKLIFLPEELPEDFLYEFEEDFDEHFVEMEDGARINLLHFKADSSRGLILYFHGNAGSLRRWGDVVAPFVDMGYDVMIMDYRGYGKSTGERSYESLLSDADRLYEFALEYTDEENLIVFGRSLGSSFASWLAGKNSPGKLILETPFYSLGDVAKNVLPIFPQNLLLRFNYKNHKSLEAVSAPVFIFHGTDDEVVPVESGKRLYESLGSDKAKFYLIEDGRHNDLARFDEYWEHMTKVLDE